MIFAISFTCLVFLFLHKLLNSNTLIPTMTYAVLDFFLGLVLLHFYVLRFYALQFLLLFFICCLYVLSAGLPPTHRQPPTCLFNATAVFFHLFMFYSCKLK